MTSETKQHHTIAALEEDGGERLDRLIARKLAGHSRSRIKQLIKDGQVSFNGRTLMEPNHRVKPGEEFTITLPPVQPAIPKGENIPLNIMFEDEHIIVIDKPAGLVVHPAAGNWRGTLVNALIHHCGDSLSGIGGVRRPGIIHRLDKDTSGLLVVAKHDEAHRVLARQFADHGRTGPLERAYKAVVWGVPRAGQGTIDLPLGRKPHNRVKMAVVEQGGKQALTHYKTVETFGPPCPPGEAAGRQAHIAALVECRLETGRTHQIRVHMSALGHPLLGDDVYGAHFKSKACGLPDEAKQAITKLKRQALHAVLLGFSHPVSGEALRFESPLPLKMARLVQALREGWQC